MTASLPGAPDALFAHNTLALTGPFGAGKTTLAIDRIRWLLHQERVRGDDILVLVPQRTLADPYYAALYRGGDTAPGPPVRITTFASLAQQSVELYWPLLAANAGFSDPGREPTFLTLETSQYHMAQLVDDALRSYEFDALRVERNRVISQILDNLNKAALLGLTIDETYHRLELVVPAGEQRAARLNALRAAQRISHAFRDLCLRTTLLDFSLQVELFNRHILTNAWSRTHLFRGHRHLVFDNAEEDTPSAHRLVRNWLPALESALILVDADAGYRSFLGADPAGAAELAEACTAQIHLPASPTASAAMLALADRVTRILTPNRAASPPPSPTTTEAAIDDSSTINHQPSTINHSPFPIFNSLSLPPTPFRFYPQMVHWTANEIHRLVVEEGTPPGEIVVLAPFVSDALRFTLESALAEHGIALATHRPSRGLAAEPAARTLLTLAKLAHPHWGLPPAPTDVTQMLTVTVDRLDPVRAHLLSEIVYPPRRRDNELGAFGALAEPVRERITYVAGEEYDRLRDWIYAYRAGGELLPLDQFFARLFGELLSQPGFGFHASRDAARIANQLVESARKFRWAMAGDDTEEATPGSRLRRWAASTSAWPRRARSARSMCRGGAWPRTRSSWRRPTPFCCATARSTSSSGSTSAPVVGGSGSISR